MHCVEVGNGRSNFQNEGLTRGGLINVRNGQHVHMLSKHGFVFNVIFFAGISGFMRVRHTKGIDRHGF